MKKTFILLPLVGLLCYVVLSSNLIGPGASANGDRTGASGTTIGCGGGGCHSFAATTGIGVKIELFSGSTLITTGYVGGTAYTLRVTGTNNGSTILPRFGFQLAAMKTGSTTANEGTLSAIAGTHTGTYTGINIVEHSNSMAATTGTGGMGTSYVVNIPWTAPPAGTGNVTAYAVLNAVDASGTATFTDLWNNTSYVILEAATAVAPITGNAILCIAGITTLSDATASGTWSSTNTGVATVATTGVVTGVSAGTSVISYTVGTGAATVTVTVNGTPAAPAAITGASVVCVGTHIYLSDATAGGVWSSTATSIATAGSAGTISGVSVGTATISYTINNGCGVASVTRTVTVKPLGGTCVSGVNPIAVQAGTELKIFPNPNTGMFTVNLLSENNLTADVVITNIVGETVKEYTTTTNKAVDIKLDRPTGIYFLTAKTATGIYVSRVMIQ
jgi:trimeric autotransporter adhesin